MRKTKKVKTFSVDTSAVINGRVTQLIKEKKLDNSDLIIPELVLGELQAQASKGREIGYIGLEEIKKIRKVAKKHKVKIKFLGERQKYEDILLAKSGRIDAMIIDVAKANKAVLITSDLLQSIIAEIKGLEVKYYKPWEKAKKIKIEDFLTKDTMSLHLKEDAIPYAKRGKPGKVEKEEDDTRRIGHDSNGDTRFCKVRGRFLHRIRGTWCYCCSVER